MHGKLESVVSLILLLLGKKKLFSALEFRGNELFVFLHKKEFAVTHYASRTLFFNRRMIARKHYTIEEPQRLKFFQVYRVLVEESSVRSNQISPSSSWYNCIC